MNSGKKLTRRHAHSALLGITIISSLILRQQHRRCCRESRRTPSPTHLVVATLYYPDIVLPIATNLMGYDYTLVDSPARQKGMVLDPQGCKTACRRLSP